MRITFQLGFALLEAGSVRSKNVTNILMKNVVDMCVGWLAFWLCGLGSKFSSSPCETDIFISISDMVLRLARAILLWG